MKKPLVCFFVIMALLPLMTACIVVGPDYQRPSIATPATWSSKINSNAPQLMNWWKQLNDPILDNLIREGIAKNQDVAIAMTNVRVARANLAMLTGRLYPTLDGSSSYTRSSGMGSIAKSTSNFQLSTRWEIELFGGQSRGIEASYYQLESTSEQLRAAMVILIADITSDYARLRGAQARIISAQQNIAYQKRITGLVRNRFEAGLISRVDLLSAEAELSSLETDIPSIQAEYVEIVNRLTVLTNISTYELNKILSLTRQIPKIPTTISAGVPADILFNRPDLRAAERTYAASTATVGQSMAGLYPNISLTGNLNTGGANLGDLARLSTINWSFGPSLSIPIFRGGQLNAALDSAKASRDNAFLSYNRAILTALTEVDNAATNLNQNIFQVKIQRNIIKKRKEILSLTIESFKAGQRNFSDVLIAQMALINADRILISNQTNALLNYTLLMKSLGGGWGEPVDVGRPVIVDGYTGPHFRKAILPFYQKVLSR